MLNEAQKIILDIIFNSDLKDIATWGGGTALSEVYLHHRLSEDIDIILSDLPVGEYLTIVTKKIKEKLKSQSVESFSRMNRFQYFFNLELEDQQKLEFVYYPFPKLHEQKKVGKILIESLLDIATSKILAGYQRQEPKDAYDIYEILRQKKFTLDNLILGVEKKFGEKIDAGTLLVNLAHNAENFEYIKPLVIDKKIIGKDIKDFFQKEFNQYLKRKQK